MLWDFFRFSQFSEKLEHNCSICFHCSILLLNSTLPSYSNIEEERRRVRKFTDLSLHNVADFMKIVRFWKLHCSQAVLTLSRFRMGFSPYYDSIRRRMCGWLERFVSTDGGFKPSQTMIIPIHEYIQTQPSKHLSSRPSLHMTKHNYSILAQKVDLLNVEFLNQTKSIPVGLPRSPIKIWGKSVQGFLSYDRKNKQTDRQTEITALYIDISLQ